MPKISDMFKGEHRSFMRYAAVITFLFLLFILFKPGSNIFNWIDARRNFPSGKTDFRV